jgi:hypothetical protein
MSVDIYNGTSVTGLHDTLENNYRQLSQRPLSWLPGSHSNQTKSYCDKLMQEL